MSIDVIRVSSSRDLRRFIDLPWRLTDRARYPQWVPPLRIAVKDALDAKANPFYREAARQPFLAVRNGKLVGRIAAIENRAHNQFHEDRVGFFGFFECAEDQEAANALFDAAAAWLGDRQLHTMRGPMNPSTNHECGLLVGGYEHHPMIMTPWNPPYYESLLDAAGFAKAKDTLAYLFPLQDGTFALPERYRVHAERALQGKRLAFRDLDFTHFAQEVERCWEIYNEAWEKNWGFFPMSHDSFVHEAQVLKFIVNRRLAFMADVDGEPAAFLVIVPDYHHAYKAIGNGRLLPTGIFTILAAKKRLRSARVMVLGVKAKYRNRGIFPLFTYEMYRRAMEMGFTAGEASWVLEDNEKLNRPLEALGAKVYRRWRIYDRALTTSAATPAATARA